MALQSYIFFIIGATILGNIPTILRSEASAVNFRGNTYASIASTFNGMSSQNSPPVGGNNNKQFTWTQLSNGQWIKNGEHESKGNISSLITNSLEVTDDELRQLSEHLLTLDINNPAKLVTINYQGVTTSRSQKDEAPLPLILVNDKIYSIPTIKALRALYDNYVVETNIAETVTNQERNEENELLELIVVTPIMEYLRNFLVQKGKLGNNRQEFKDLLKLIWFNLYPRGSKKISSSGFEHVFMTEIKKSMVSGLHNWLYFKEEEGAGRANYLGFMKKIQLGDKGAVLKHHSTYRGIDKPVGSMFMGTSPELEIALYSVCFILRADKVCPLKMDGKKFIIRTYSYTYKGKNMVGSAFPEI